MSESTVVNPGDGMEKEEETVVSETVSKNLESTPPVEKTEVVNETEIKASIKKEEKTFTKSSPRVNETVEEAAGSGEMSMADLLEEYESDSIENGAIVKGTVVDIKTDEILIDVGYKSEGVIPRSETFEGEEYNIGDEVEVMVIKREDKNGNVVLSRRRVTEKKIWDVVFNAKTNNDSVEGKVVSKVKGGLNVDLGGLIGFVPGSQIDIKKESNFEKFIGQTLKFVIVEANRRRKNIILSRRRLLEEKRDGAIEELVTIGGEGSMVSGTVRRITDFGAFVDVGGVDGLLHITDLSWGHVKKVTDVVNVGDEVEVMVLSIDREKGKVSLGLKQKSQDPWLTAGEKYQVGSEVEGTVRNIVNYGAFVEIEPGLEGLVHHSDMSWTRRGVNPKDLVDSGEKVKVRVLELDVENKKISLGMKQLSTDPWDTIASEYTVGMVVQGKVTNIVSYGAFVELKPGLEGLVHVSDMSWTNRVKNPADLVRIAQLVDVRILEVDTEKRKVSFGMKQVTPDPWTVVDRSYDRGEIYTGKITNVTNFGIFVELEEGIEGLVHVSDISWTQKIANPIGMFVIGGEVKVRVLEIKPEEKRISLGIKQVTPDPWSIVDELFKVGETYTGTVKNLTNFGAFVELREGIEGLIHVTDMSWTEKIEHPSQILKSGEKTRVKILEINPIDKKISLGLKQLVLDPWTVFEEKYHEGMVVEGEILRITNFGAFVKIEDGIEGLVHISQLSDRHVGSVDEVVRIGDRVKVKIIEIKDDERKLRLSIKEANEDYSKAEYEKHIAKEQSDGQVTLGDLMSAEMLKKLKGNFGVKETHAVVEAPKKSVVRAKAEDEEKDPVMTGAAISPEGILAENRKSQRDSAIEVAAATAAAAAAKAEKAEAGEAN